MQIGSLRQLTLVSFMLALVPLVVLLWQSQSALSKMSDIAASEAQFSVGMARNIGKIESVAVDVERSIRQYHVIKKDELKQLTQSYISRILVLLDNTCAEIQQGVVCASLLKRLDWFQTHQLVEDPLLLDAQLAEFRRSLTDLRVEVDDLLDARIQSQQAYVNQVQQSQAWSTAVLVTISLLLIIFASQLILLPVAKIERVIGAIARQSETLPSVSTSGPKELIKLEHQLHWLSERLSQLENLRSALLRHASHELKTPLASIKEGCSLLSEGVVGRLNDQQVEVLSLLNSSTERLNLLIEQLLDYNLLLQQAKPVYQIVDANQLVNDALTDNALAVKQNNHQIVLNLEVEKLFVDENLYRRIVDNLLSNALAHGTVGRPIDIRLYKQGLSLILDVANRGRKIPLEQRKVLFEPFKRGDNKRNDRVVGSGLGLSIVADCARMMHGTAEIVDVDYADVCVRVCLSISEEHR